MTKKIVEVNAKQLKELVNLPQPVSTKYKTLSEGEVKARLKNALSSVSNGISFISDSNKIRQGMIVRLNEDVVGFKACKRNIIVKLLIPKGSLVHIPQFMNSSVKDKLHRKLRASSAVVLGWKNYEVTYSSADKFTNFEVDRAVYSGKYDVNPKAGLPAPHSAYDSAFVYEFGKTLKPKGGFSMNMEECTRGVHFFLSEKAALYYFT